MNWTNVRLIFQREFRDQLRDRRTLFTIVVLPLLLYPLLGMSFLQVAQFMQDHPTSVWIIGTDALPNDPPLLVGNRFHSLLATDDELRLIRLTLSDRLPDEIAVDELRAKAEELIQAGVYDVIVYFPPSFGMELERVRRSLDERSADGAGEDSEAATTVPEPRIFMNMANDRSRIAHDRIDSILRQWRREFVRDSFQRSNIPAAASEPFFVSGEDVAHDVTRRAAVWSKVLPFVVLIWALTGAFYPAIDLCAGEKERGTLETLLSSPARRSEIVWGKLLTVGTFSVATSLLNLFSMGVTGTFIIRQVEPLGGAGAFQVGPPPVSAVIWLVLALIPMAALFSALSLAVAAFARSSKEGQYYLMPLLMIMLPLMMLPILPATQLNLGTSLIPVTGMMLLLRALVEGHYAEALTYTPPVLAVTAVGCLLAIRWAIDQFNNESVLFRESERWELRVWLRHLVRDRGEMPTFGEAVLCGILLILIRFFAGLMIMPSTTWNGIAVTTLVTQIAFIATPAMLMAIVLTRRPRKTLQLTLPRPSTLLVAPLLAVVLHPTVMSVSRVIQTLYPMSDETREALTPFISALQSAPLWSVLLVVALTPAICEELAFRGFILSGLRHSGRKWTAILLSSLFFGVVHSILQQSLSAFLVGLVIGFIAVQTSSLLPCILFHAMHNTLGVLSGRLTPEWASDYVVLDYLFHSIGEDGFGYRWPWFVLSLLASAGLLLWLRSLPYQATAEEQLQRALDRHAPAVAAR